MEMRAFRADVARHALVRGDEVNVYQRGDVCPVADHAEHWTELVSRQGRFTLLLYTGQTVTHDITPIPGDLIADSVKEWDS